MRLSSEWKGDAPCQEHGDGSQKSQEWKGSVQDAWRHVRKPAAGGGRMRTLCIARVGPRHIFEFEWQHLVCLYKKCQRAVASRNRGRGCSWFDNESHLAEQRQILRCKLQHESFRFLSRSSSCFHQLPTPLSILPAWNLISPVAKHRCPNFSITQIKTCTFPPLPFTAYTIFLLQGIPWTWTLGKRSMRSQPRGSVSSKHNTSQLRLLSEVHGCWRERK